MKKYLFLIILLISLVLFSCTSVNNVNLEILDCKIVSKIENQIQHIDEFRLDKIVLEYKYQDDYYQNKVLSIKDIENYSVDIGYHEFKIKEIDKIIPVVIYDDLFINENYIYYTDEMIFYSESIFNTNKPVKDNFYFTGWYTDIKYETKYYDGDERIVRLYPRFSNIKMCEVNFYLDENIIDCQYVLPGNKYEDVSVDSDVFFYGWYPSVEIVYEDLNLKAILVKNNECLVEFFDEEKLFDFKIVKKGDSVSIESHPTKEGHTFDGWSEDLSNIDRNIKVYANYKRNLFCVNFYNDVGDLLETDNVLYGDSASFDSCADINGLRFSTDFSNVKSDLDVIVNPMINYYYVEGILYDTAYGDEIVDTPARINHTGFWKRVGTNRYESYYIENGQILNFHFDNGEVISITKEEANKIDSLATYLIKARKKNKIYHCYTNYSFGTMEIYDFSLRWDFLEVDIYCEEIDYLSPEYVSNCLTIDTTNECFLGRRVGLEIVGYVDSEYYTAIDRSVFSSLDVVIIGPHMDRIIQVKEYHPLCVSYIIVDENNPNFYSIDGVLYDKLTDEIIINPNHKWGYLEDYDRVNEYLNNH